MEKLTEINHIYDSGGMEMVKVQVWEVYVMVHVEERVT
jgi:hypothetical protein